MGEAQCLDSFMYELCVAVNDVQHVCTRMKFLVFFGVVPQPPVRANSGSRIHLAGNVGLRRHFDFHSFEGACSELGGLHFFIM